MDSNRKFINFKDLLAREFNNKLTPIVIPCGNIRKAESILNSTQISTPHIILLHIGINDLDDQRPENIALKLKELSESFQNKFNCEVFISGVTPRGDHYQNHVHEVNNRLKLLLSSSTVKLITHKNLNPSHLHDDRHLRRNKNQGESTSGVQLLAKNLFEAQTKKSLQPSRFDKILCYTPKTQFRHYKPTKYQNKMNKEFVLGDPLNSQYQYTSQYPNHYQTTYQDFNHHYSNHANSYVQNLIYRYPNAVQWGGY